MTKEIYEMLNSTEELFVKINNEIEKIWKVLGNKQDRVFVEYVDEEIPTSAEGYVKLQTVGDGCEYTINFNMIEENSPASLVAPGLSIKNLKHRAYMGDICEFGIKIQNMTSGTVKVRLYTDGTNTTLYESPAVIDTYGQNEDNEFAQTFIIENDIIDRLSIDENIVVEFSSTW